MRILRTKSLEAWQWRFAAYLIGFGVLRLQRLLHDGWHGLIMIALFYLSQSSAMDPFRQW